MTRAEPAVPPGGSEPAMVHGAAAPTAAYPSLLLRFRWLAFALVLVVFLVAFNGQWRVGRDSATFRGIARNLVRSHQYVFRAKTPSPRAARRIEKQEIVYPGMPLMLAGVEKVFGPGSLAPQLAMYLLAILTLGVVYYFFKSMLGLWVAVAVTFALGLNRVFLEHANELLSDLPFLLGLMLALWGFEKLRRAHGAREWMIACALSACGIGFAASMRPTFWMLTAAWVATCLWGIIWPEASPAGRRRTPYVVALGLLVALALLAIMFDPRTHGAGIMAGGYEAKVEHQLGEWQSLLREAWDRRSKSLNEHIPTCFFAFAVKQSSTIVAKTLMTLYSLMVIAAGVALVRVSRLWGLLVAGSVVSLSVLGDNPRYYLMILPLLLAGWCLFCAPVARWLGPERPVGIAWADRLFGWAPRHPALPALAMLWGLGIVMFPNFARDLDLIREQRGFDHRLHHVGFVDAYEEGKQAPIIHAAEMVGRSAPPDARVLGPEPTILTFISDRQVYDLDRMTGRWGRGWRQGLAAMNLQLAVFPPRKAGELYGDRDPVVRNLFDYKVLVCTRELDRTPEGARLGEYSIRTLPGEHVRGSRASHYRPWRRRHRAAVTRPAG